MCITRWVVKYRHRTDKPQVHNRRRVIRMPVFRPCDPLHLHISIHIHTKQAQQYILSHTNIEHSLERVHLFKNYGVYNFHGQRQWSSL